MILRKRPDGTYITQHNGKDYHVVPRSIDPANLFDFDEVKAWADAHPGEVVEDGFEYLDDLKARAKAIFNEAWVSAKRKTTDFKYKSTDWQCDEQAQANLNSYIALVQLGMPGPFEWRNRDNVMHQLSAAELIELAGAMLGCIQGIYRQAWTAKAEIDTALSHEAVKTIVANNGGVL